MVLSLLFNTSSLLLGSSFLFLTQISVCHSYYDIIVVVITVINTVDVTVIPTMTMTNPTFKIIMTFMIMTFCNIMSISDIIVTIKNYKS